jgi:tetratricopeptide (TPR) repeat protein
VKTQWWPKKLFVVFKAPAPGQRHIFKKGEPYVQILFVPEHMRYEPATMSREEEARRADLESGILLAKSLIAKQVWHSPDGLEFNDHYKVLTRTFEREGTAGVETAIRGAIARYQLAVPQGRTMAEYLNLAFQYQREGRYLEAKLVLFHTQTLDPNNAEAGSRMAILGWLMGLHQFALSAMQRAVMLQPRSPGYHANLGEMLRHLGRHEEAEASLRASLALNPRDAQALSILGLVLAAQGRAAEGLEACRAALAMEPKLPMVHFRMGSILAKQHQYGEARGCYNAALAINPGFVDAQRGLQELPAEAPP